MFGDDDIEPLGVGGAGDKPTPTDLVVTPTYHPINSTASRSVANSSRPVPITTGPSTTSVIGRSSSRSWSPEVEVGDR